MAERVAGGDGSDRASVLAKAFAVLGAFDDQGEQLTLGEIVERTGLAKGTAHRILGQLIEHRVIERNGWEYHLGMRLFELASHVPAQRRLREAAVPFMQRLCEATRETVHLGVLVDCDVVYVEKIHGRDSAGVATHLGGRMPAHCTGLGKAILANSPDAVVARLVECGMPALTRHSIVVAEVFRDALARARQEGVAFDREEVRLGVGCVAAPILDRRGVAIGAISVTSPLRRSNPESHAALVREAALGIRRAFYESGA